MRRRGFTLVELLVVIGIIAVLLGILLPVLARARHSAQRTLCASNLHQLVVGCTIYSNQFGRYPDPQWLAPVNSIAPTVIEPLLYNQLSPIMGWKPVNTALPVGQFPGASEINPVFCCPAKLEAEFFNKWDGTYGVPWFVTGYAYYAGIDEDKASGAVLNPAHLCRLKGPHTGVMWADSLNMVDFNGAAYGYAFFHFTHGVQFDPMTLGNHSPDACEGIHRAWSDGSVEWMIGSMIKHDKATADQTASYRAVVPGLASQWWWN